MNIRLNNSNIRSLVWGFMILLTLSVTLNACDRFPFPEDIIDPIDRGGDEGGDERDSTGGGERDTSGRGGDEGGGNGGDEGREGGR